MNEKLILQKLGKKIKETRKSKGLTQRGLGAGLMPHSSISAIEKGKTDIKLDRLLHIAKILGVDFKDLLS